MCLYMLESSTGLALRIVACKAQNLNFALNSRYIYNTMGAKAGRRGLLSKESFDDTQCPCYTSGLPWTVKDAITSLEALQRKGM